MPDTIVISSGTLKKGQLSGDIALITGAGGGIGYETARSLVWLGAKVVIAEVDKEKGKRAETEINREFGEGSALFIHTDIGDERSVEKLVKQVNSSFGKLDILINNATIAHMGAVHKVSIDKWDLSYRVNLRGPVLLISHFLPGMLERDKGVIILVPSSGAAPYMGAYEIFKTSQVELANTLSAELEGTGVITYSIGPGIVKTDTAHKAIEEIAPLYGKSVEEFYKMSEAMLLSPEEAGAGFAASVALAERYRGLEIGSIQALSDIGVSIGEDKKGESTSISDDDRDMVKKYFGEVKKTFIEQSEGWYKRPIFERQWVIRDFKKSTGFAPEYFAESLKEFEDTLNNGQVSISGIEKLPLEKLRSYYLHQIELLKGYEKNPEKVREYSAVMEGWIQDIDKLDESLKAIMKA